MVSSPHRAVVFDLDGTLADTLPDLQGALNRLLAETGRRPASAAEVRGWVGDGVAALVARALAATGEALTGEEKTARFLTLYRGHAAERTKLYPNVAAALETLAGQGFTLGVCTNKPQAHSMEVLEGLGISRFFKAVVGGDAVARKKPHPEHLQTTLAALGVEATGAAVMVGDSSNDVATARAAGVAVVAVSFGYAKVPAPDLGADRVIDDFAALPETVASLLGDRFRG